MTSHASLALEERSNIIGFGGVRLASVAVGNALAEHDGWPWMPLLTDTPVHTT